jgi:hypothetical protein
VRGKVAQHSRGAVAHVVVSGVVRREGQDAVLPGQPLHLEPRRSHLYAQRLHFGGAGYPAAIVVGLHDHGHVLKLWREDAVAGEIKVVDVHQRKHGYASHGSTFGGVAANDPDDNALHLKL